MSGMKVFKFDVDEDFAKQHNEMVRETKNMVLSGIALFILSIAGGIAAWIFIDPTSPWRLLASVGLILFGLMMLIVALMLPKSVGKTQALYDAHPLAPPPKKHAKPPRLSARWTHTWTHASVPKAYNSLNHLWRNELLFVYLNPPEGVLGTHPIKATTNSLKGGINSQLKLLARTHRGRRGEHQRRMLKWWLYLKTELPDDPVEIARQSNWGQDQLADSLCDRLSPVEYF